MRQGRGPLREPAPRADSLGKSTGVAARSERSVHEDLPRLRVKPLNHFLQQDRDMNGRKGHERLDDSLSRSLPAGIRPEAAMDPCPIVYGCEEEHSTSGTSMCP